MERKRWIEDRLAVRLGAADVKLDDGYINGTVTAGASPTGWLRDVAYPGDTVIIAAGRVSVNGDAAPDAIADRVAGEFRRDLKAAKDEVRSRLRRAEEAMHAACRLAQWAGHGWTRMSASAVSAVAQTYAEVFYDGGGPRLGTAVEAMIASIYMAHCTPGPVGWGITHPDVDDNGTVSVVIGTYGQLIGQFRPDGRHTITAAGPGGRRVTLDAACPHSVNVPSSSYAKPRDYARARAAMEAARVVARADGRVVPVHNDPNELQRAVAAAAREYGLAESEEYLAYAAVADSPGRLLAGRKI